MNGLFGQNQYGFRNKHSSEYAVLELVDHLTTLLDSNETPVNIFIDLSKVFHTLDHSILLDKLHYYGVRGTSLNLLNSYLCNRAQYVQIEDTQSEVLTINTGVPQGSILGPLLFIIYLNDFPVATEKFNMINYADDSTQILKHL